MKLKEIEKKHKSIKHLDKEDYEHISKFHLLSNCLMADFY